MIVDRFSDCPEISVETPVINFSHWLFFVGFDATHIESGIGRFANDARTHNTCNSVMQAKEFDGKPYLFLKALRIIQPGQEIRLSLLSIGFYHCIHQRKFCGYYRLPLVTPPSRLQICPFEYYTAAIFQGWLYRVVVVFIASILHVNILWEHSPTRCVCRK
jgi:hypothetical protein